MRIWREEKEGKNVIILKNYIVSKLKIRFKNKDGSVSIKETFHEDLDLGSVLGVRLHLVEESQLFQVVC